MTVTLSHTVYSTWSTQIKEAASTFWGRDDPHIAIAQGPTWPTSYWKGGIRFPGVESLFPAGAVITSATMYVRVTSGIHAGRVGNPTIHLARPAVDISSPAGQHVNCGGPGLTAGSGTPAFAYGGVGGWLANTQGSVGAVDVREWVRAIVPGNVYVNGYGYGVGLSNTGGILTQYSDWGPGTEIWSAMDATRKPYIVIYYEYPNRAPNTPTVTAPSNNTTYELGDRTLSINNPGDPDNDAVAGHIEYGEVASYGATPGAWTHQDGFSYVLPSASQTRGKWYAVRGRLNDEHSAYGSYSSTIWFYVNRVPNQPTLSTGMQPIHNLDDLSNDWSGTDYHNQAKPNVQLQVTDPEGHNMDRIDLKLAATPGGGALHSVTKTGTFTSGGTYDFDLDYGLQNDVTYYLSARTRDVYGAWGEWNEAAIKVRWSDAIYEHNIGASSAQPVFSQGTLAGSSPQAAYAFRSATGASGAGAGAWKANIEDAMGEAYINVRVRLSIGRDSSTPTSLSDMRIDYIGTAQQPDKWDFGGDDTTRWQLTESERRYGTKALRWSRFSSTMTNGYAYAETVSESGTDPLVVPVVGETQYTLSLWVKGNLNYGKVSGYCRFEGETVPVGATVNTDRRTEEATGVLTAWTRLTTTFTTPAGTTKCAIGVQYESTGSTAGDILTVDAVQLEEGPVASPWNPGQTGAVIIDVGGIAVDAERGGTLALRGSNGGANDVVELGANGLIIGGSHELYGDVSALHIKKGTDDAAINITGQADGDLMQRASGVWLPKALGELGIQADHLSDFNTHADARITALVNSHGRGTYHGEMFHATLASGTMTSGVWYDPLGGMAQVANTGGFTYSTSGYIYTPSSGTYLVVAEHQVGSPAGGQRIFGVGVSNATWSPLDTRHLGSSAIWNNNTSAWIVRMGSPGGSTWMRFKAYQDSGASIGLAGVRVSVVNLGEWS